MNHKRLLLLCLALLLVCLPALAAADTVVAAPGAESTVTIGGQTYPTLSWEATEAVYAPHADRYAEGDMGYHDDSIDVRIETFRAYDTNIMAVYVTLTDVSQFRTAFAGRTIHSQSTTPVHKIGKRVHAVLAINDDYCNYHAEGIVVRNGKLLRMKPHPHRDALFVDKNGDFTLIRGCSKEQYEEIADTVLHSFCFGPAVVMDGQPITQEQVNNSNRQNCGPGKPTQRITISQTGHLQYLILSTEGPENKGSRGLTILEMAQLCVDMGLDNAYNLDGGSSSTVAMNNRKINSLSSGKVREVGGCIWFASLVP